ncbi:hypothetical protein FY528_10440 [Hymenobacter lutimineralis]|uniref:Uncharacterized protein n=1 Tax=Hymenobacter lutimineralis TaxID=2606448 RepID=A0A5D6V2B7_9BACT|nr:hypothetical protein [Hymenobacter lutimineralis]TYZ09650.1 hypothetical protein FY528_10440 [Hymenobacter lutimineralis]
MIFAINGQEYEIVVASDFSTRFGIGCELWEIPSQTHVAEIFRDDKLRQISMAVFISSDIPLQVLEALIQAFDEQVGREFCTDDIVE